MIDCDFKDKIEREEGRRYFPPAPPQKPAKGWYILGFLVAVIILFSATLLISGDSRESLANIPFLSRLLGADKAVKGESADRINILLLGIGGKDHDGGLLTDTIIIASLQPSTKKVTLLSIPRDLAVPVSGATNWQKVNSINAYAEMRGEDGSQVLADNLSSLLEIPIDYYVRADFEGFIKIINDLGGIDVVVDNILDDYQYPIRGQEDNPNYYSRYEHLRIDKGLQHFDGDLALKYVRSRHAGGGEGSDFARSKRQQKVLAAVKDKLMAKENLLRPGLITKIVGDLNNNISTNLKVWEMARLWALFKDAKQEQITNQVLDDGPKSYLVSTIGVDGAFLLVPKTGNFSAIRSFVQELMSSNQMTETMASSTTAARLSVVNFVAPTLVEIKNGTTIGGLATEAAAKLRQANFSVIGVSNASQQDILQTSIFDLTYGAKPDILKSLRKIIGGQVSTELPDWLVAEIKAEVQGQSSSRRPDFIIILGADNATSTVK